VKFSNQAEHIARHLNKGRKTQNGWVACCPAHEDNNPSLSITQSDDQVLVHCFAGCSQEDVITALKLKGLWEVERIEGSAQGLTNRDILELPPFDPTNLIKKKEVAWYDYTDEENELLYQVVRYDPKSFRQRRPDGSGGWINSLGDIRKVPYRLSKLQAAIIAGMPILIVEGEKDVHSAESIGCVATCNAMGADTGAGTKWLQEFGDYFIGADVIIIPDQDIPGQKHANHVARTLNNKARSIRIANPPLLCKDLADWVERGATFSEIESCAETIYAEEITPRKNIFTHVGDPFMSLKPIDWLVDDYFELDSLAQMFGEPGSGKSFIALSIACAVATGTPWHGKEVKQGAVFYICGEGHAGLLRRFGAWSKEMGIPLENAPLYKSDHQVSLSDRDSAKHLLEDIMLLQEQSQLSPRLIVIDTVARNFGGADENSTKDMSLFIENVDRFVRIPFKANVLLVHHSGHTTGRARGSSALKAALDAEYMVEKDEDFVVLTPTKMKDAELPPSLTLQFKKVELGEFDGEVVQSAMLTSMSDSTQLRVGKRLDGRPIQVVDVLTHISNGWISQDDAMHYLECSRKTVVDSLGKLVGRSLIVQNTSGAYELTSTGRALLSTTGINLVSNPTYHYRGGID
jgi:hypothetical protein